MTVALCIIRLTDASLTPGSAWSVRCTKDWHAAQVIPETGIVTFLVVAVVLASVFKSVATSLLHPLASCFRLQALQHRASNPAPLIASAIFSGSALFAS